MNFITRKIERQTNNDSHQQLATREWLLTNGLGGYASGTIAGVFSCKDLPDPGHSHSFHDDSPLTELSQILIVRMNPMMP